MATDWSSSGWVRVVIGGRKDDSCYLWGDDVEKVPSGGIFLSKHIAVLCLKKHVQDFDNERAAAKWAC